MKEQKLFALAGMALLGVAIVGALYSQTSKAQSVTSADSTHTTCKAALDYPNSNGYTESYARPNTCHQKRVFYNYGSYFAMGNCGAGPWCSWRVRCPAGASIKTHNSGGGWHYSMSPNISGMYDGPAHNFCVDAAGNQVDPLPGESESNPYHTHTTNMTGYQSFAKAYVTDTNTSYFYSFKDNKWYDCPGVGIGSLAQEGYRDLQAGSFPVHYHCRNDTQNLLDSDMNNDNAEAPGVLLSTQPSTDLVGSGFGTQDDTTTPKDQFVDKTTNWGQNPLGTVRCAHSQSDKVYFSTIGTCPNSSQFPVRPSFNLTLVTAAGSTQAGTTTRPVSKFKIQNTTPQSVGYEILCTASPAHRVDLKGYLPTETWFTGSPGTDRASYAVTITASTDKEFGIETDISGDTAIGSISISCSVHPQGREADKKTVADTVSIAASAVTTQQVTGDLIGHWKFDGNGANEVSGSPAAVTVGGASFKSDGGKLGGYAYIPSGSDWVKIPYRSIFDLPNSFTIEFWFRQRADRSFLQDLVYKGTPTNNYNFRVFRQLWNQYNFGPVIAGHTAANTGYWTQPSNPNQLAHNVWHHVVFTKDTTIGTAYYLDGVRIGSLIYADQPAYSADYIGPAKTPASDIIVGDSAVDTDIDNLKIYNRALRADEVAATPGLPAPITPPPGAGAPEPPNNDPGVWAQVDVSTGQIVNTTICTRSVCGINGEYHGYVPPPTFATGSTWWPTTKRYIWQMSGQAGYSNGSFNFNTYVFTVTGGTIYNGVFTATPTGTTTWPGTSTPPTPVPPPTPQQPWPGTGTPPIADHTGCDETMYNMQNGRYVDERGTAGPGTETLTNTGRYYKLFESGYHYHLCGTSTPGTSTWPVPQPPGTPPPPPSERPSPQEPRECGPGEMPFMPSGRAFASIMPPNCFMPMYRWNLKEGKWDKCDAKRPPRSVNFYDENERKNAQYTSCQSMDYELDADWRAERFRVHDPRIDGNEWYEPPWDATAESFRYNHKTDAFEKCGREPTATMMMPFPNEYTASCTPVPEKDKSWMLMRARANYKQHQKWQNQKPNYPVPEVPFPPDRPSPEKPQPPVPLPQIPEIPQAQCKPYLLGLRSSLNGDKQFWKDVNNQLKNVPKEFEDRTRVEEILKEAKALILELDKLAKKGKCSSDVLSVMQEKQGRLHGELFAELSSYLSALRDFTEYEQCVTGLKEEARELGKLDNKEAADAVKSIEKKLRELSENREDFEYDAVFECREFRADLESRTTQLRLSSDTELNRIVDEVVEKKFEPIIAKLTEQLEQSGKKIDELIFKVAEVHKAIESVSQSASQISEKIAVSYAQLSRFSEEYEKQRTEIQTAKDRLIPLVEMALQAVKEKSCVPAGDRESLVQEFGKVASVNWLSEKASELEKRLNFFITSCRAKDVSASDLTAFHSTVSDAQEENLRISYEQKITPFPDVPTHEWYYGGMVTAAKEGYLTQGRPGESVLRQDALLMVLRAAGLKDEELKGECEVGASVRDVSPYARCAVAAGQKRGLTVKGNMSEPIQRGEVARWISELNLVPAVDAVRVRAVAGEYEDVRGADQSWQNPIARLVEAKVMVGVITDQSKKWQPRDPLTRAALAVVLEQLLKK